MSIRTEDERTQAAVPQGHRTHVANPDNTDKIIYKV